MLAPRKATLTLPLAASLLLAACNSSGDSGSSSGSSDSSSSSSSSVSAGSTVSGTELGKKIQDAAKAAKTYHMVSRFKVMSITQTSNADVQYTSGDKTNVKGTSQTGPAKLEMIGLNNGSKVWVKSPQYKITDWTPVTAQSKNALVKQLASNLSSLKGQLDNSQNMAALQKASKYTAGARTTKNGVQVTPYRGVIPAKAFPSSENSKITKDVPVTLEVDDQGRAISMSERVSVGTTTIPLTIDFSDYGKSLNITAPK